MAQATDKVSPNAWVLTGHRVGDNNQVLALAEHLGWPFEIRHLVYRSSKLLTKLISRQLLGVTLAGVDRRHSSSLEPPWPDIVISAGRDNEPVARWIRQKSGGHTRLVHMGRPWAPLHAFDLIITTPQYSLPKRHNILENEFPLHRVTGDRLQEAARKWRPHFAHLPRPYTAVLVGGNSGTFTLTKEKARRMGQLVNAFAISSGGSVLVSDSARTPTAAFNSLCRELTVPAYLYRWTPNAEDNPYFGYLALADHVVVTGESVSMLTEASITGKPLFIFDLSDRQEDGTAAARPLWKRCLQELHYRSLRHRLAMRFGPQRMQRDIGAIQRRLVANGRAFWLTHPLPAAIQMPMAGEFQRDVQRAVSRVRELVEKHILQTI